MSTAVKDSSYFIPAPSKWPAVGSVSMILTLFGAAGLVNGVPNSHFVLIAGLLVLVYMFFGWLPRTHENTCFFGSKCVNITHVILALRCQISAYFLILLKGSAD